MSETDSTTGGTPSVVWTEKEQKVLNVAWLCLKTVPEVDIPLLASKAGFQTTKTCSNTWGVIKKKLASQLAQDGRSMEPVAKKAAKAPVNKGKGKQPVIDEEMPDADETPAKVKKEPVTPKKRVKKEVAEEDEMDDIHSGSPDKKQRHNTPDGADGVAPLDFSKVVTSAAEKLSVKDDNGEGPSTPSPAGEKAKRVRKPKAKSTPKILAEDEDSADIDG